MPVLVLKKVGGNESDPLRFRSAEILAIPLEHLGKPYRPFSPVDLDPAGVQEGFCRDVQVLVEGFRVIDLDGGTRRRGTNQGEMDSGIEGPDDQLQARVALAKRVEKRVGKAVVAP
jgi:hypothetical protein